MEFLEFTFMQRALLAGAVIGMTCAMVGVFVIHKGMSFLGAGIAHASFGGVALGVWLGLHPVLTAVVFCLVVGWIIAWLDWKTDLRGDTAVGIFFAATMAMGILLLGMVGGYRQDLFGYMFGSILAVSGVDLWIVLAGAGLVVACLVWFGKELLFMIFDPEGAAVAGLPTGFLHFLLTTLITITVVISIKVVGIVLVSALLVTPAATAALLSRRFEVILGLAALIGILGSVAGLVLSFYWNTASGATIVSLVTVVFLLAAGAKTLRRAVS